MNSDYEVLFEAGGFFLARWLGKDERTGRLDENFGRIFVGKWLDNGYTILEWEEK